MTLAVPEEPKDNPVNMVRYIIDTTSGRYVIAIPSTYKVTYGQLQPGVKGGYGQEGNVLRIYESANQQRAVFNGVKSFRDLSIPVKKLVKATETEASAKADGKGNNSHAGAVKVEEHWEEESI